VLSFNGNKIVTTGGGGAILTNDDALADRAKHLTTTAKVPHRWRFDHDAVGYNFRLPNLNAALGVAQLERLSDFVAAKRRLAARYRQAFADLEGAAIVPDPPGCESNAWLIALRLETPDEALRDAILAATNEAGFMTRPAWTPLHRLPMYADAPRMDLSRTEALAACLINLPSSAGLELDRNA
jgi:perosamine synthetase